MIVPFFKGVIALCDSVHQNWVVGGQKQHLIFFFFFFFIIGLGSPAGIAVDTVTTHLYIVDSSKNRIIVCNSYGDICVIIQENLSTPEDIVIIHKHRYVQCI